MVGSTAFNRNLHGLRGYAALGVFFSHCYTIPRDYGFWPEHLSIRFGEFLHLGRYGVEIFFLISGYLITESLRRKADIRVFLIERSIRLHPAYIGLLIPLFAVKWLSGGPFLGTPALSALPLHFISNALFLPGVLPLPLALGAGWTLSFEAAFYLTAVAAFWLARRYATVIVASVCVMIGAVLAARYPGVVFFFVGAGVYLYRDALRAWPGLFRWPLAALVIWMLQWPVILTGYAASHRLSTPGMLLFVGSTLASLLFFVPTVDGVGVLTRLLRTRVFQYFGDISYSFYLWHSPVMIVVDRSLQHLLPSTLSDGARIAVLALASLPVAIVAAHLSWRVCEKGIGNALRRRLLPRLHPVV